MERASVARLPLKWGSVQAFCYRSLLDGMEHIAMVKVSVLVKQKYSNLHIIHVSFPEHILVIDH